MKTEMRTCRKCGLEKPLTEFRQSKPGYRRRVCNECMDRAAVEWQQQNRNRLLKWRKSYYEANREKQIEAAKVWNANNPEGFKRSTKKQYHRLREEAMAAYGGYVCACCGEDEPIFMTIDHVENDQCERAKEFGRSHTGLFLYTWLKKNGYPQGFQVLCHNCNQGKRLNGGVCPHQVNKA
jgi:hypothetical protein